LYVQSDDFVSRRSFGDVQATAISVGTFQMSPKPYGDPGELYPSTELDSTGRRAAGLNSLLLEAGGALIVIDPGHWPPGEGSMLEDLAPTPGLDGALAALGVAASEIDFVVVTHGHFDHCTGVLDGSGLRFPNATHLLRVEDWDEDGGLSPEWHSEMRRFMAPVADAGRLEVVEAPEHTIVDGVTLVHAPGETPGHAVLRVATADGPLLHLADLIHLPGEAQRIDWAAGLHERDLSQMVASRRRFLAEASQPGTVSLYGHAAFPAWGSVQPAGPDAWRWEPAPVTGSRI
jgi:glyoxylase-like metal-dependent hydrolase (beta-lactamase superfamily II)